MYSSLRLKALNPNEKIQIMWFQEFTFISKFIDEDQEKCH